MAFNSPSLALYNSNAQPILNFLNGPEAPPQIFSYITNSDNVATVSASGYFNPVEGQPFFFAFQFRIGDFIYASCSDANVILQVTAVAPNVTTSAYTTLPAGSITTADLANLAVTAAKIANATITTTQISATANITGSQLAAAAGITGGQIAATTITAANITNATITTTQISNTAGIVGTQLAAGTLTSTELALSVPQTIRVPITAANFKAAYTAGLAMIAAAGAGTIINIIDVTYTFGFLTASYTAGGVIQLQYSTAAPVNAAGIAATVGIAATDVTGLAAAGYERDTGVLAINGATGLVNAGVWFTVATQNFATGAGALVANITYNVLTV